jgi:hypothetical protein
MVAELTLVEDRLISGRGVLRVPESARKARYWILYIDVIRRPTNEYKEFNWNPSQSLYARLAYLRDGYVQTSDTMRYLREQRTYINDITGQNLRAIKCAYEGTLQTFFNLGNALALPSISVTDTIKDFRSIAISWDQIFFSCYSSTALQVRFYKMDYDVCNEENDDSDDPPPPPPPLPEVPPGTNIGDISPPYTDRPEEPDNTTQPFPGDELASPIYAVVAQYIQSTNCSIPTLPITYYFGEYPEFINRGNPICGGSKWEFTTPAPFGFDEGNGYVSPTPGVLFDGSSNYLSFTEPTVVPDPRI